MSQPLPLTDKVAAILWSRVLVTAMDTLIGVALVRLLSQRDFAIFSVIYLSYEFARQVAALGVPESVFYFFEHFGHACRRALVWQTGTLLLATSAVVAGGITVFAAFVPWLFAQWSNEAQTTLTAWLPLMGLVALLEVPTWPVGNILIALDRPRIAGLYQVLTTSLLLVMLVVPSALAWGLPAMLQGLLAYAALRFVASFALIWAVLPGKSQPLPAGSIRAQLAFAAPLGAHAIVARLHRHFDKFLVALLLGEAATAVYSAVTVEIPVITALPYAVGSVFVGRYIELAHHQRHEELIGLWHRGIHKVGLAVVPITVFFVVFAEPVIQVVFATDYTDAMVWPFRIYTLITLQRVAQYGVVLQAFARTSTILSITLGMLAVNVALSAGLALAFGVVGATLATALSSWFGWYLYQRKIAQALQRPIFAVFPWQNYSKKLLLSTIAGAIAWATLQVIALSSVGWSLVQAATCFFLSYFALATFSGHLTRGDYATLWRVLRLGWGYSKITS